MFEHVLSPYTLKGKEVKNRFTVPAMVTNFCATDGKATDQYLAYHEARAKGGWGLMISEDYAVDPTGRGFINVAGLWEDSQIESHSELPKIAHKYGATILAQIYHSGRQTNSRVTGSTPYAPSAIPCPVNQEMPKALTTQEVKELVSKFGDTALRAKKCSFDGVEIHGAHGYLLAEFLSPYVNKRTDEYGGNITNRMRMALEIVEDVRNKCGDDFIIGFRISGSENIEGGRTIEETRVMARLLEDAGVDIIHVSAGVYASSNTIFPNGNTQQGWIVNDAQEIKSVVDIPVITVGRITDPMMADSVIAAQKADFVSMGRGSLADPEIPNKVKEGRYEDVRHCISCNHGCVNSLNVQKPIRCILNPLLGKEANCEIKTVDTAKNIAVVGAGPAGLEAAIVAKKAGHHVTVYEKESIPGGQLVIASIPPFKGDLLNFTHWQVTQCHKLGIEIKYDFEVTVDKMKELKPDTIIVATGADPIIPPIKGVDMPHVLLANNVLTGKVNVGANNIVIGAGQVGVETAHHLGVQLKAVTIVEMQPTILPNDPFDRRNMMGELSKRNIQVMTNTKVKEIKVDSVIVDNGVEQTLPVDTVILALGSTPNSDLAKQLEDAGFNVELIGDAKEVSDIMSATSEAFEVARSI